MTVRPAALPARRRRSMWLLVVVAAALLALLAWWGASGLLTRPGADASGSGDQAELAADATSPEPSARLSLEPATRVGNDASQAAAAAQRSAGSFELRVLALADAARREIRVRLMEAGASWVRASGDETAVTLDDQGTVRLPLERDVPYTLLVRVAGYAAAYAHGVRRSSIAEVRLASGHALRGRVVTAAGAPAPGIRMTAVDTDLPRGAGRMSIEATGRTDADGRFVFEGLRAGRYAIYGVGEGFAETGESWAVVPATEELLLRLRSGTELECLVESLATGLPIEGAEVCGTLTGRVLARSDARGFVSLTYLDGSSDRPLWIRAPGFSVERVRRPSGTSRTRVRLQPACRLVGRLLPDPCGGAVVRCFGFDAAGELTDVCATPARTGADLLIPEFSRSHEILVVVSYDDGGRHVASIRARGAEEESLGDIGRTHRGVRVSGRVTPGDSVGTIMLYPESDGEIPTLSARYLWNSERSPKSAWDASGAFAFDAVPPGRWTVICQAPGWADARRVIEVGAEDVTVDMTFEQGEALEVHVTDAQGGPADLIDVQVQDRSGQRAMSWQGSGRWTSRGTFDPRPFRVHLWRAARARDGERPLVDWSVPVEPGERVLHVRLPGPRDIAGSLSGGEAPYGGKLRITARDDDTALRTLEVQGGSFVLRDIGADPADVLVEYLNAGGHVVATELLRSIRPGDHALRVPSRGR